MAVPTNMCQAGAAATEFLTTDARVTAFAAFQQVAAGDVIVIQWAGLATSYTPAPVVATPSGPGNFCFATSLPIAGGELAKYPGEWIVLVFVNGQFAGSQPFTIKTGAAPTGPTINAGGVVNGADCRVLYSGLAPGFAGLYQINFYAPDVLTDGMMPIEVRMGAETTQPSITMAARNTAPPAGFTLLGSATVDTSGGTLTVGGVQVSVAKGSFSAASRLVISENKTLLTGQDSSLSSVYALQGLPAATSGPITLTIDLLKAPADPANVYISLEEDLVGGRGYLAKATVQGQRATVTLPALATSAAYSIRSASSKTPRAEDMTDTLRSIMMSALVSATPRAYGGFAEILVVGKTEGSYYDRATQGIAAARKKFAEWGLDERLIQALPVQVSFLIPTRLPAEPFGEARYSLVPSAPPSIIIDNRIAWLSGDPEGLLSAKIAHLLTHLAVEAHYPVKPYMQTAEMRLPWLWMDEAVATAVENSIRSTQAELLADAEMYTFLKNGLSPRVLTSMKDPAVPAQRLHGHRAGLLLDYIRTATSDGGMIGRIYTRRMNAKSSAIPLPLDLLKIEDTSLGAHWAGFCQWMFSRIPAQIIAWASDRTLTFADGGQPILAPLPSLVDLSALPYRFRSTRTLLPGAKYTINVAGTGAASAVAYKLTGASAAGDYIGTAEPRLEFPVTQIGSGESFLALLVKQRAEPPYTAATPTELTVTYVDAGAPPGLERFTYFKAAISAAMRCTQAMAPVTCPIVRGGMALYNYIEGIFPLSWQGLNFSGNWTASRATYTVSGSVTADLSQLTQLRIRETYTTAQPAGTIDFTFVLAGIPALMDYSGVVDLPALARLEYTIPWIRYIANPGLYVKELTGTFTPSNGGTPTMYVADLPNTRPTEPPISVEFSYSRP